MCNSGLAAPLEYSVIIDGNSMQTITLLFLVNLNATIVYNLQTCYNFSLTPGSQVLADFLIDLFPSVALLQREYLHNDGQKVLSSGEAMSSAV